MPDLISLARAVMAGGRPADAEPGFALPEHEFVEAVSYADADAIREMLRVVIAEDWSGLPVWARNLSYRLACLQCPDDADLLREAAADLYNFGPDWDDIAADLQARADRIDGGPKPGA